MDSSRLYENLLKKRSKLRRDGSFSQVTVIFRRFSVVYREIYNFYQRISEVY